MVQTLLVDDSDAFRRTMRELLAARFPLMRLAEASSAASALRIASRRRLDIVFVDVRLPDANGLELVRSLRRGAPHAAACVVTAFDLDEYREAALQAGAAHFLAKSNATPELVVEAVRSMLASRVPVLVAHPDAAPRTAFERALVHAWPVLLPHEAGTREAVLQIAAMVRPPLAFVGLPLLADADPAFVRALRAAHSPVRVAAFAPLMGEHVTAVRAAGADEAISWPADGTAALLRCVAQAIGREPVRRSWDASGSN